MITNNFQNYPNFSGYRPSSLERSEPKRKNLSMNFNNRSFHTPDQATTNFNLFSIDKFRTEKPDQSPVIGPSRRHHSFINHSYSSPEEFYFKEAICPSSNRNYQRYLAGFEMLEENPSDEERTCMGESPRNSFLDQDSPIMSDYNVQMEDSFYKRFSELKVRSSAVQNFKKPESQEPENEKKPTTNKLAASYQLFNHKPSMQSKGALVKFEKREEPKSLVEHQVKKVVTLPYQANQLLKSEGALNLGRITHRNKKEATVDKENRKPNLPQQQVVASNNAPTKRPPGTYEELLKKYLNKNTSYSNNANNKTATNTPKATIKFISKSSRPATAVSASMNLNQAKGIKTLSIGIRESLKNIGEKTKTRQNFVIPTEPPETERAALTTNKGKTLTEVISNHSKSRKPSTMKNTLTPCFSEPFITQEKGYAQQQQKHRVHRFGIGGDEPSDPRPSVVQAKCLKDIRFDMIIGQGAYAVVKLAIDKQTGKNVAVKTYEKSKLLDPARMRNVRREISLLKELDHPNIIKLHSSFETPKQIHLVMEYIGKVSLQAHLKSKASRKIEEYDAKRVFKQLCKGIHYCHSRSIVHRDIKLDNVLLDENFQVKIIDFGFSICVPAEKRLSIFCGTPCYMAPEIVSKLQYKGPPSDVWALGIVLYALLCGKFPFRGFDEKDLFSKIKKGKYEVPEHLSAGACGLLQKILDVNPENRITVEEILEDSWLNGL